MNSSVRNFLIGSAVATVAVAGGATWYRYSMVPKKIIATAEDRVTFTLKDPTSALFRNVAIDPKTGMICGFVNAKNTYGGYVGFRLFRVSPDGEVKIFAEEPDEPATDNPVSYTSPEAVHKRALELQLAYAKREAYRSEVRAVLSVCPSEVTPPS